MFFQWVASVDLYPNEDASVNVTVDPSGTWVEQDAQVHSMLICGLVGVSVSALRNYIAQATQSYRVTEYITEHYKLNDGLICLYVFHFLAIDSV